MQLPFSIYRNICYLAFQMISIKWHISTSEYVYGTNSFNAERFIQMDGFMCTTLNWLSVDMLFWLFHICKCICDVYLSRGLSRLINFQQIV